MIILGIDPGIADTGYGLIRVEANGWTCLDYGSIKTAANLDLPVRLQSLFEQFNKIIALYQPQQAAIEQLFFCKNVKTALVVGQARGVALLACQQAGLSICEFTPPQVKQAVTTYGQADKLQVQKMVQLLLRLPELPQPDDAADALAIAICAAGLSKKYV